jgi:hypothetical protein
MDNLNDFIVPWSMIKGYDELTFQQLCTMPTWNYRRIYEYSHKLRMKYNDLNLAKLNLN